MSEDYIPQLLTSEDVYSARFPATKFRDGYDQNQIDDYLDEVVRVLAYYEALNSSPESEVDLTYITVRGIDAREVDFDYTRMSVGYDQDAVDDYLDQVAATLEAYEHLYGIPPSDQRYQPLQVDTEASEAAAYAQAKASGELPPEFDQGPAAPMTPTTAPATPVTGSVNLVGLSSPAAQAVSLNQAPLSDQTPVTGENPQVNPAFPQPGQEPSDAASPTVATPATGLPNVTPNPEAPASTSGYPESPMTPTWSPMDGTPQWGKVEAAAARTAGMEQSEPFATAQAATGETPVLSSVLGTPGEAQPAGDAAPQTLPAELSQDPAFADDLADFLDFDEDPTLDEDEAAPTGVQPQVTPSAGADAVGAVGAVDGGAADAALSFDAGQQFDPNQAYVDHQPLADSQGYGAEQMALNQGYGQAPQFDPNAGYAPSQAANANQDFNGDVDYSHYDASEGLNLAQVSPGFDTNHAYPEAHPFDPGQPYNQERFFDTSTPFPGAQLDPNQGYDQTQGYDPAAGYDQAPNAASGYAALGQFGAVGAFDQNQAFAAIPELGGNYAAQAFPAQPNPAQEFDPNGPYAAHFDPEQHLDSSQPFDPGAAGPNQFNPAVPYSTALDPNQTFNAAFPGQAPQAFPGQAPAASEAFPDQYPGANLDPLQPGTVPENSAAPAVMGGYASFEAAPVASAPEVASSPEPATAETTPGPEVFSAEEIAPSLEDGGGAASSFTSTGADSSPADTYATVFPGNYPSSASTPQGAAITEVSTPALPSEQDSIDFSASATNVAAKPTQPALPFPPETPADAPIPATASAAGVPLTPTEAAISAEAAAIAQQQPQPQPQAADLARDEATKPHGSAATESTPRPLLQGEVAPDPGRQGNFVPHFLAGYRTNLDTFTSVYGSQDDSDRARTHREESLAKQAAQQRRKSITSSYLVTVITSKPLGGDDQVFVKLPDGREVPVTQASSNFDGVHLTIPYV